MKTKFFTLFAAMMLLFGAKAMAQTNGDVNEDGVVNEQDITAIIQIMQEAGGVKEPTKYYWYAGWTIPTAENIATIVNEANGKAGAYIGTSLGTYSKTNPLAMIEYFDESKYDNYYVVVPEGIKLYDSEGDASLEDQYSATSIVIPGHRVLKSIEQQFSIGAIMLR
jgi:hypothetical protein